MKIIHVDFVLKGEKSLCEYLLYIYFSLNIKLDRKKSQRNTCYLKKHLAPPPPPALLMCSHLYASGFRFYRKQCIPLMLSIYNTFPQLTCSANTINI